MISIYYLMRMDIVTQTDLMKNRNELITEFIHVTGYVDDFSLDFCAFIHLQDDINTFIWWEENKQ